MGILHENYPRPWRKQQLSSRISAIDAISSRSQPFVYRGPVPLEPAAEDIQRIEADIVKEFTTVFDQSGWLNCMEGSEMIIELKDDAEPFYVNGARSISFTDSPEVKHLLDEYVAKAFIIPVTEASDRATLLVVARKVDNSLRLCVDPTRLNRHVRRPTHPTRTPRDAVAEISGDAKFFTTFHAANGYFQIALHPSLQHLTIFMTPWGRYKFLRASMGLCISSDEYNRRADQAFQDVNNTVRVVDDLLRFDSSFPELAGFSTDVVAAKASLRPLLSNRTPFVWTSNHDSVFSAVKKSSCGAADPDKFQSGVGNVITGGCISQKWNGLRPPSASWIYVEACWRQFPLVYGYRIPLCNSEA